MNRHQSIGLESIPSSIVQHPMIISSEEQDEEEEGRADHPHEELQDTANHRDDDPDTPSSFFFTPPPAKTTTSTAEEVVRRLANRIGLQERDPARVKKICDNLRQEFVVEESQLINMDSFQWKEVGAPIGLVTAIQAMANHFSAKSNTTSIRPPRRKMSSSSTPTFQRARQTRKLRSIAEFNGPAAISNFPLHYSSNRTRSTLKFPPTWSTLDANDSDDDNDHADPTKSDNPIRNESTLISDEEIGKIHINNHKNNNSSDQAAIHNRDGDTDRTPKTKSKILAASAAESNHKLPHDNIKNAAPNSMPCLIQALARYKRETNLLRTLVWGRAFSISKTFQRAMFHSKSGADLKAYTVFMMELNILAAALFFGGAVSLWGTFPNEFVEGVASVVDISTPAGSAGDTSSIPYVPTELALLFHFLTCINIITLLVTAVGWTWSIHAAAAVSGNNFHKFVLQTHYALDVFHLVWEIGQILFILNIALLLAAQIAASTTNSTLRTLGYYLPLITLLFGCRFLHTVSSYVGRVAYHGMLLMDCDPEQVRMTNSRGNNSLETSDFANCTEKKMNERFSKHVIIGDKDDLVIEAYQRGAIKMLQNDEAHAEGYDKQEDNDEPSPTEAGLRFSLMDLVFPVGQGFGRNSWQSQSRGQDLSQRNSI